MRRIVLPLLLATLLAGCTTVPGLHEPEPQDARTEPEGLRIPDAVDKRSIPVTVALMEGWVRPWENVTATADAPANATLHWYLANRNPPVPGYPTPLDRFPVRTTGAIRPNATSDSVPVPDAGRYVFRTDAADAARLNVTVRDDARTEGLVRVFLAPEGEGVRFAPSELTVRPGTPIWFRNTANAPITVTLIDYLAEASNATGKRVVFPAPDLMGDYDVVVVARDPANGWGEASTRLIVDKRKPVAHASFGPYVGHFDVGAGESPAPAERRHELVARHNLTNVTITWNTTPGTPGLPSDVRVQLVVGGRALARSDAAPEGVLEVPRLERGDHDVVVTGERAANADYEVRVTATRELVPPASFFQPTG